MRFLIRLGVLALAAFGAKALFDKYAPRAGDLKQPANDFMDRAKVRSVTPPIRSAALHSR